MQARILIVDDQPANVKLLATYLKTEGYALVSAFDGEQALQAISEQPPDLVLLDVMMPGLNGYQVVERIKADPDTAHIPVVLVTALDSTLDRVRGLDAGADEFLSKPVNRTELQARVRSLLKLKQAQDALRHRGQILAELRGHGQDAQPDLEPTVLLLEEDPRLVQQLTTVLGHEGYRVLHASGAEEAKALLQQYQPALILLDVLLRDVSGLRFMEQLKQDPLRREIPVIIITALQDMETKVRSIESGAEDYLIKPVEPQEMIARIRAALRRARSVHRLRADVERLFVNTVTDTLTQVYNRHFLEADMRQRIALAKRNGERTFSFLLVELDAPPALDDRFGERVLEVAARLLQQDLRTSDVVTRYGGQSFGVVLPETTAQQSLVAVNRLRVLIAGHTFEGLAAGAITLRVGISSYGADISGIEDMILRAETLLREAGPVGGGRRRVVALDTDADTPH